MAIRKYGDVLAPDDLTFLSEVFDRICANRGLSKEQAVDVAARLVAIYQAGSRDEEALLLGLYPVGISPP